MKVVTAAEMREIDRRATEEYGVPSSDLMERAEREPRGRDEATKPRRHEGVG